MRKNLIQFGASGMAVSICLGALGAHQFKKILSPGSMEIFHTAVDYFLYHSLAFLLLAALFQYFSPKHLIWSTRLFFAGMLLFSGSLFAICFLQYQAKTIPLWLGILTPLGGLCFIAGWAMVAIAAAKKI